MTIEQTKEKAPFQDFQRYVMFAKTPGNPEKNSILNWGIRDGFPYISVRTNVPEDQDNRFGMITASFSPLEFKMLLDDIQALTLGENGQRRFVTCFTTRANPEGGRSEPFKVADVHYGKSKTGINWISVQADERPKIIFEFKPTTFHSFKNADGSDVSESDLSNRAALALLRTLDHLYTALTGNFRPPYVGGKKTGGKKADPAKPSYEDFDDIAI